MPFIEYVSIDKAANMVRAINNARTKKERRDAQLRCEGYKKRCEELNHHWPCVELDFMFIEIDPETGNERPTCCGEYLDWKEKEA